MYIISKLQTCLICIFTVISWQIDHSFPEVKTTGYNTSRAYGTSRLQAASAVGTTGIVTRGFNLGKAMINLPRYHRKNTD